MGRAHSACSRCGRTTAWHRCARRRAARPSRHWLPTWKFLREGPAVAAGDLNNHTRWDRPGKAWNHANTLAACQRLRPASAYHAFEGVEHGSERHPTFYWRVRSDDGPTFHIDYVFVPRAPSAGSLGGGRVARRVDQLRAERPRPG